MNTIPVYNSMNIDLMCFRPIVSLLAILGSHSKNKRECWQSTNPSLTRL